MNIFKRFWRWLWQYDDDDAVLDHVPVRRSVNAKKLAKARAEAQQRHGKKFHADVNHPRETPKSRDLMDIEALTQRDKDAEQERREKIRTITKGAK